MTNELYLEIILMLIALFTLIYYFDSFFKKRNRYYFIATIAFYIIIQLFMEMLDASNPFLNLIVNVGLVLAFGGVAYEAGKIKLILVSTLFCVLWLLTEIMLMFILMTLRIEYNNFELMGAFLSKLLQFIVVKLVRNYYVKNISSDLTKRYSLIVLMFPISSILIIACIFYIADKNYNGHMALISSIACTVVLMINIFVIKFYDKVVEELVLRNQNTLYAKQLQLCEQQIVEREETMLTMRTLRHDLKNHFVYIREMLDQQNISSAAKYIDYLIDDITMNKQNIVNTGNVVIDTLINFKYSISQREKIDFQANVVVPYELPCNDADICIILGNILDNAIEAAGKTENGYINLKVGAKKTSLSIVLRNSFSNDIQQSSEGILVTSKENKQEHGFGLLSVRRAVDKYNGNVNIDYKNNEFIVTIILFISYQ